MYFISNSDYNNNNKCYSYNNNPSQINAQMQLNSKKLVQLQDQNDSYEIMNQALNAFEGYAIGNSKLRKYAEYDYFDSVARKAPLQMKKQLIYQLRRFKESYELYEEEHGKGSYPFPEKLKKEIFADINLWKTYIPKEDRKYYDAFIDLINGKKIPDFKKDYQNIPSEIPAGERSQNYVPNLINAVVKVNHYVGKRENEVKKEYEKKGDINFVQKLFGKPGNDPYLSKINPNLNN